MMFKQTVFVAILAVMTVSAKKPCCGPKQFMAGNGGTVGQVDPDSGPQGFFTYQYGAFDYTNRMFGYNMTVTYPNGTATTIKLIQKYAEGYQYIILEEFQYCQRQPVTKPEPINCIPANATWTSSLFIGGSKGLYADSWTYNFVHPKDPVEGVVVINVFESNCYPFGAWFIGDRFQDQTRDKHIQDKRGAICTKPAKSGFLPPATVLLKNNRGSVKSPGVKDNHDNNHPRCRPTRKPHLNHLRNIIAIIIIAFNNDSLKRN